MSSNYMALVGHCVNVITNQPGGVSWARLLERVGTLGSASRREKTQVFEYLKKRPTLWDNGADDMSETIFMLRTEAPTEDAVAEASTTKVSATASSKRDRLARYGSTGVSKTNKVVQPPKPEPVVAKPEVAPVSERVVRLPGKKIGIVFGDNELINEDDVIAEMAWHVYESGEHGMALSSLRMSVPEFSECADADRAYLIVQMRQRYGIGYYEKEVVGDRVIKVLAKRTGSDYRLERPDWFIKMGRMPFVRPNTNTVNLRPQVATFGSVAGNSLADQLSKLNAVELFANNAGVESDEFDEEEDDSGMEMDGKLVTAKPETMESLMAGQANPLAKPTRDFVREWTHTRPQSTQSVATAPAAKPESSPVKEAVLNAIAAPQPINEAVYIGEKGKLEVPAKNVVADKPANLGIEPVLMKDATGVSKEEVSQAADTLRLIAAQLEAQATVSDEMRKKKDRFDILMRMARESSVQIQTALDAHNELLDDLQKAANDLTAL